MANPFCLIGSHVTAFQNAIRSGRLDPIKLQNMDSAARHAEFSKVVGENNAGPLNAAFESKLLLKNQQAGLIRWIMQSTKAGSPVQRELLARVDRMDARVLNPASLKDFYADLAKQKLGFGVTMQEAGQITQLAQDAAKTKAAGDWDGYMTARANFREYVGDIGGHGEMTAAKGVAALARASALSWPTTIAKLTGVALSRVVTTPIEDVVAMGVSKALPGLAKGAPRMGSTSPTVALKAEAAAQAAMWTDGMIDAGRMLKNKASRLDLAHSEKATGHAWYEYFGSIHGALKEPIKRAEYARSLYRRTVEAAARGEDVKDMTVRMRLSTEAFKDGQRAISMQDNTVSNGWNALLGRLEQVNKETGKPSPAGVLMATALRTEMPVMRAPTNVVAEASQYISGILTGPAKAAWEYAHGIENLKPVQRDAIIREISKGSVGAAIMLLYYFKHKDIQFGGFYEQNEKRKPGAVKADELRVFGQDIPKQLIHHPMFLAGQYAAAAGHVYGEKATKGADPTGAFGALAAASIGLMEEVPIIGQLPKDIRALSQPSSREDFMQDKTANVLVPGTIQWVAKQMDPDTRPRKGKGFVGNLEERIPVLRERVPFKKKK